MFLVFVCGIFTYSFRPDFRVETSKRFAEAIEKVVRLQRAMLALEEVCCFFDISKLFVACTFALCLRVLSVYSLFSVARQGTTNTRKACAPPGSHLTQVL